MPISFVSLILLAFLLNSCASKGPIDFEDKDNSGITDTFDIKNGRLAKFQVERAEPTRNDEEVLVLELATDEKRAHLKIRDDKRPDQKQNQKPPSVKPSADLIGGQIIDSEQAQGDEEKGESEEDTTQVSNSANKDKSSSKKKTYPLAFHEYDKASKKLWDQVVPVYFADEEKVFAVKYLGITAAHIKMSSKPIAKIGGEDAFHYVAQLKSARFYERIYKMDDTVETFVSTNDFLPIRYTLVQRETGQNVDDLQIFDHEKKKTYFWYKRDKDGKRKKEEKEAFIPKYFQDTFSALFFARGFPFDVGASFEFPIVTRTRLWLLKMKIEDQEEIKVMGERILAFRIEAETRFPAELSRKPGKITIWVSADQSRRLLKFKANVKFGSIDGELQEYKSGGPAFVKGKN